MDVDSRVTECVCVLVCGWASVCLHRSPENDKQIIKLHLYANRGRRGIQ